MKPTDLTDVLLALNPDTNDSVSFDPNEVVTIFAGATETLKITPAWTLTLVPTRYAWGASTASGSWGLAQWG